MPFEIDTKYWNYGALFFIVLGLTISLPILLNAPVTLYWIHKAYPVYITVSFVLVATYYGIQLLVVAIRREPGLGTWLLWIALSAVTLVTVAAATYSAAVLRQHVDTIEVDNRLYHLNKRTNPLTDGGYDVYKCFWVEQLCEDYGTFTPDQEPFADDVVQVIRVSGEAADDFVFAFDRSNAP